MALWQVRIPIDLANKLELLMLDPVTGRSAYGAKSQLVERLLREYVREREDLVEYVKERKDLTTGRE